MLDGRNHFRKVHALDMRVRSELYSRETKCPFPYHRSDKSFRQEIRHYQPLVVDAIAAAASQSRSVKNVVAQMDVAPRVAARAFVQAVRERSFPTHIDVPGRCQRRTKCFPQVEQLHPSSVTETPSRFCEVGHFRLRIEVRPPGAQPSLLQCESFSPSPKFSREISHHSNQSVCRDSDDLHFT